MDRRVFLALIPLALPCAQAVSAAAVKPYDVSLLIAGFDAASGIYEGGVDIRLDPGWKTYWRMPGDSGIPPHFDWSGSNNVKDVEVLWPAPQRFNDAGGETVGYKTRVVFPLRIVPQEPGDPVELDLAMFFGVCQDVCIPGNVHVSAVSGQADPAAAALIADFAASVPHEVTKESPIRVTRASLSGEAAHLVLRLDLEGSWGKPLDIFVESKTSTYFRAAKPAADAPAFLIETSGAAADTLRGALLKLTMTSGDIRLEQDVTVE